MKLIPTLSVALACALSMAASAQWQWIDPNGHPVFSDRAPPADIPEKNILKRPKSASGLTDAVNATSAPAAPAANGNVAPPAGRTPKLSGVERALLENKKQAAEAAADKHRADEEKIAKLQAESCARARQAKLGLDAGVRIARTNAQGEREFLDESGRAEEAQRIQSIIEADCK